MTTHEIRKMMALDGEKAWTQKEFADHFGIPLSTVKNWDARNCMPAYIFNMVEGYVMWRKRYINVYEFTQKL